MKSTKASPHSPLLFSVYRPTCFDSHLIYLSIYPAVIHLKGVAKTRHARVHGDSTLPSPSMPCLLVGEHTEEGLPRPLAPSL